MDDLAPEPLRDLSKAERLSLVRYLAEQAATAGIPLGDTTGPLQLARRHDRAFVARPHAAAMDSVLTEVLGKPNDRLMIFSPPQLGKLVAHETPVPTPTGWTTHGELRPGDEVFHPSGRIVRVRAVSTDDVATLRVSTSDGGSVTVHPAHEWTVYDRSKKRWRTMETREMASQSLTHGQIGKRGGRYVFQLPKRGPIEGRDSKLPVDPYSLGLWLGDGSTTKPAIKHVPMEYLRAPESDRRALLAGLVDSDGTISHTGQVSFSNTDERLISGYVELLRTLGYRATVSVVAGRELLSSGIQGTKPVHMVSFTPHDGHAPSRLARKANNLGNGTATTAHPHRPVGHGKYRRIAVTAIEEVAPEPGRCIEVDSPDGLYLVGEHFTPTHNSLMARWFLFWWLTMHPNHQMVLASYAAGLAHTHGAAVRELVRMYGDQYGLNPHASEFTKAAWRVRTGGSLRATGVAGGLSGQPMDLGVIDDPLAGRAEAESPVMRAAVWDWYSGVWTARRSPSTRECLIMTRWHPDDLAGRLLDRDGRVEEGGAWRVLHMPAIAVAPDVEKGIYPDPLGRAPGDPVSHPKIADGDTTALLAFWAEQRARVTARDWHSMWQGMPFDAEGALLSAEDLRAATDTAPVEFRRVAVGVDPSGGGRDTAGVVAAGLDGAGHVWWLADRTARATAVQWPRTACLLAYELGAERVVYEKNYGGDMPGRLITQAWDELAREGVVSGLCPLVVPVVARKSKVLRAEPIAQAVKTGRVWFARGADLKQLTTEWQMWEPGSSWSPGALDAGVHVATHLLPALPRAPMVESAARVMRDEVEPAVGSVAARSLR